VEVSAIRVFVGDLGRARGFYGGTLGLPELWDAGDAVGYDVGATLIVERGPEDEPGLVGRFVGLSFGVADVAAAQAALAAKGVPFLGPPELQAWGGVLAHFRDPDGNVLTLVG